MWNLISDQTLIWALLALTVVLSVGFALVQRITRRTFEQRINRLEESIRIVSAANAGVGRQLVALDRDLKRLAVERPASAMQPANGGVVKPVAAGSQTIEDEHPASEPTFSAAEQQLAALIKSRMGGLRAVVSG